MLPTPFVHRINLVVYVPEGKKADIVNLGHSMFLRCAYSPAFDQTTLNLHLTLSVISACTDAETRRTEPGYYARSKRSPLLSPPRAAEGS